MPIPRLYNETAPVDPIYNFLILPSDLSSATELRTRPNFLPDSLPVFPNFAALKQVTEAQTDSICRCLRHTDIYGRCHSNKAEEHCVRCFRLLPWAIFAADHVIEVDDTRRRSQEHEASCLSFRSESDARKCACCKD